MNKRQKPLLPSLRQKKRYLAFEIISDSKIDDFSAVLGQIMDSSVTLMGELEAAKAGITVMHDRWDNQSQKGIIKVGTKHLKHLSASLAMITSIQGKKVTARSLGVSGTLKKAGKYIAG
ncbi:MAG: ribonuclease P [Nanoarchaeota archaeon]|nr:ribonuclease P [Nanoarchaeota archaeon]